MPKKTEDLGNFEINKWKIKAVLVNEEYIVLKGKKGSKQLIKKYQWDRVKNKIADGLENWIRYKF